MADSEHFPALFAAIDNAAAAGNTTVVASLAGKRIMPIKYSLVCAGAVTVQWRSGGGANLSGPMAYAANGGISEPECRAGIMASVAGEGLVLNVSGAVQVGGMLTYIVF